MRNLSIPIRTHRRAMATGPAIVGAVLWCIVIISLVLIWNQEPATDENNASPETSAAQDLSGDPEASGESEAESEDQTVITINTAPQQIPDFTLQECQGEEFGLTDLQGRPWVASFIFTRCRSTCPVISRAVKDLHDRVAEKNPDVMFVTMTVDSEFDTVEVMKSYSEIFDPDPARWKFVTGEVEYLRDLIVNGFGIYVKENLGNARRPGMEVAHSNRVVLVDSEGMPSGTFLGTNPTDMAELAQILLGKKPFPDPVAPVQVSTPEGGLPGVEIQVLPVDSTDESESAGETEDESTDSAGPDAEPETSQIDDTTIPKSTTARLARMERLLPAWARSLPTANAMLNSTSTVLLTLGWFAIRRGNKETHRNFMIAAFVVSVAFLACYLTSHWALDHYAGERGRPFGGTGIAKTVYYLILVPHVLLAATVPILAIRVFQHAAREHWDKHRRLARITFPIWMYVSITGVVIYGMLYHWPVEA